MKASTTSVDGSCCRRCVPHEFAARRKLPLNRGDYGDGVVSGIQAATQHLMGYFPNSGAGQNELPDKPEVL